MTNEEKHARLMWLALQGLKVSAAITGGSKPDFEAQFGHLWPGITHEELSAWVEAQQELVKHGHPRGHGVMRGL